MIFYIYFFNFNFYNYYNFLRLFSLVVFSSSSFLVFTLHLSRWRICNKSWFANHHYNKKIEYSKTQEQRTHVSARMCS